MFIRVFGVYAIMTLSVFLTIFLIWFICFLIKRQIRRKRFKKGLAHFSEEVEKSLKVLLGGGNEDETKENNTIE